MTTSTSMVTETIHTFFDDHGISLNDDRLLVALSGGLDSTVLAHALVERTDKGQIVLGHVNHQLRDGSDDDEAFCLNLAADLDIEIEVRQLDVAGRSGESVEAWARRERYAALEAMAEEVGAKWILTAHHADDQAETVLMRLAQGASMLTLAGIRPKRGRLLRPLLNVTRDELELYAADNRLQWVDDPSNSDRRYLRNRLRHDVLARTIKSDPSSTETLLQLARLAQNYEQECVREATALVALAEAGSVPGSVRFPVSILKSLEPDLMKVTLRLLSIAHLGTKLEQRSKAHWQSFSHFVRVAKSGKIFDLSKSVVALKDREDLIFITPDLVKSGEPTTMTVGLNRWRGHEIRLTSTERARVAPPGFLMRSWQSGERPRTRGGQHSLVSDLMTDAKLSVLEKRHWPIVASSSGDFVWLPGLGERGKVFNSDGWRMEWRRLNRA